jgi:hypothetical protein
MPYRQEREVRPPPDVVDTVHGKAREEENLLVVPMHDPVRQPSRQEAGETQAVRPGVGRQEEAQDAVGMTKQRE